MAITGTFQRRLVIIITLSAHLHLSANGSVYDANVRDNYADSLRSLVVSEARSWIGHKEIKPNWSPEIERWLASCKPAIKYPAAWCAAWLAAMFRAHLVDNPNSVWCPSWSTGKWRLQVVYDRSKDNWRDMKLLPGDVCTIYNARLKRDAHVFMVEKETSENVYSIEGNTNNTGSREGDGVYARVRHKSQVNKVVRLVWG
jgi:hypothetical protein